MVASLGKASLGAEKDTVRITTQYNVFDGGFIRPYSNKWKVYFLEGDNEPVLERIWTDYMQSITIDNVDYLSRTQELYGAELELQEVWTNLFVQKTMLPKRASQMRMDGTYQYIEFESKQVKIKIKQAEIEERLLTHTYEYVPFDWSLYGVLLSALPLKTGWVGKFPILDFQSENKAAWLLVTIQGKESIITEDGRVFETFKIVTNQGLSFWVSKKAPYVIQLELQREEGQKNLWTMY
jgi:hypothetical protein